jgi:hypothetical protein
MLSNLCDGFQTSVESLNPKDAEFTFDLRVLVMRLVSAVAVLVGDYPHGEIPALMHLCGAVLTALAAKSDLDAEAEDLERRRCRYRREQAVLNLVVFCDVAAEHHSGSKFDRRRNEDALSTAVGQALGELVHHD